MNSVKMCLVLVSVTCLCVTLVTSAPTWPEGVDLEDQNSGPVHVMSSTINNCAKLQLDPGMGSGRNNVYTIVLDRQTNRQNFSYPSIPEIYNRVRKQLAQMYVGRIHYMTTPEPSRRYQGPYLIKD